MPIFHDGNGPIKNTKTVDARVCAPVGLDLLPMLAKCRAASRLCARGARFTSPEYLFQAIMRPVVRFSAVIQSWIIFGFGQ